MCNSRSRHWNRQHKIGSAAVLILMLLCAGCSDATSSPSPLDVEAVEEDPTLSLADDIDFATFEFADKVASNREDDGTVGSLQFIDTEGKPVRLDKYEGEKNVLLVFTRGFSGQLCPFCTTQTSRLIANYDQFKKRDAEVLLVYPGAKDQLPQFKQASLDSAESDSFPFPVLLDEDLAAVKQLGIAAHLAYPSTFIIDKQGQVRLSYVGSNPADRPSIKALLAQLDRLAE